MTKLPTESLRSSSSSSSSNTSFSSPSDSHESSSSGSSDVSSASLPSHSSPLKACQSDLGFLSAAPDPSLYQQTSVPDDDELSDIVDWDNLSVDLEADENQDKFNCLFINYEAQESSGDDCIQTNEQLPSRKLNSQSCRKIQIVDYSSSSDENEATHGLA